MAYPVAKTRESLHFVIVDHDVEVVILSSVLEVKMIIISIIVLVG